MQKLIIKRSEWLRGEGSDGSYLYRREDGKRCCLGFLGKQLCGITDEQMAGKEMPNALPLCDWLPKMLDLDADSTPFDPILINSIITAYLSINNDRVMMSEEEREKNIAQLMIQLDVEVVFVD